MRIQYWSNPSEICGRYKEVLWQVFLQEIRCYQLRNLPSVFPKHIDPRSKTSGSFRKKKNFKQDNVSIV
jgi:hypothetical protein